MQDERPIDLSELGSDQPARDLVGPVVRRFRLHAVLLTVVAVISAVAGAGWIGAEVISNSRQERIIEDWLGSRFARAPMVNRREAWFELDGLQIGVLAVRALDDGQIGLRVLVIKPEGHDGKCCVLVTSPGSEIESHGGIDFVGDPAIFRSRYEDFMMAVPAELGRSFEVEVTDVHAGHSYGSFIVDLDELKVPSDLEAFLTPIDD